MTTPPFVDAHVHVFARPSAEFPRLVNDGMPADRQATVEELLAQMQAHDVAQAVLVQTGGNALEHHAYLRRCLADHPDKFRGIGLIPADCADPERHMDTLAAKGDIIGFRLTDLGGPFDPLQPIDLRGSRTYPIWKRAAEKDYVLWLYPRAGDSPILAFLVDAFPQVRVVFNHLMVCVGDGTFTWDDQGRPQVAMTMPPITRYSTLRLNGYENVCVHLSGQYAFSRQAWPYADTAGWQQTLLRDFGAERLMWGSDFPWIVGDPGYGRTLAGIDASLPALCDEQRQGILGATARRFLRLPGATD
ncbi:MAG: amidohydrolase family protein [bacterium]|nr:amidohydrolase family protein [bacterium]